MLAAELGRIVALAAPGLNGGERRVWAPSRRRQPERLASEASFAALCGASPVEAPRVAATVTGSPWRGSPGQLRP